MNFLNYFQIVFSLGVLASILYVLVRLAKVAQARRFRGDMKIVDRLALDTNCALVIVDIKGKEVVLSVSGKEVSVLKELSSL